MTTQISADNIQQATLESIGGGPTVTNVQITDSNYDVLDDTAVSLSGGYLKITGTNFASGCEVIIGNVNATSVAFVNSTTLNVQVPAANAGTYIVYAVNSDGGVAIRVNGLTYSSEPTWVTGSDLSGDSGSAISIQLTATGASVYTLQAGSTLPENLTLSSSGLLSGTVNIENETLYNFTVVATDAEFQDSPRTFSITITTGDIYFAATTLLLSGSADTFVKDASTNNFPVTVVGDTKPNNFNPYLTGWSNQFDGTGDYLTTTIPSFGTEDFTIEGWTYNSGSVNNVGVFHLSSAGFPSSISGLALAYFTTSAGWNLYYGGTQSNAGTNPVPNTWYHFAVVRSGTALKVYINGVLTISVTDSTNYTLTSMNIGGYYSTSFLLTGYISNLRVVTGTAVYTANFTPPTQPLTAITGTSLLTCQSYRFVDNSTNNFALTRSGDVKIQSFSPFVEPANTNGSGYFDGNGDYLTVSDNAAFDFTGDFTMEAWVYPTAIGANNAIAAQWVTGGLAFLYKVITNGRLQFVSFPGTSVTVTATTTTVGLNQWSHVAVTRSGTTVRLFVNGVMDATTGTVSGTLASTTPLTIGTVGAETVQYWNGYLSNLRIVKGTAVYTANFTPSTSPLAAVSGTSLLTLQTDIPQTNSQFLDSSSNNLLVTRVGNTTQGSFSPYSPAGWSNYFDGNNDYITPASNAAFTMGTGNFTYECWVNRRGVNPVSSGNALTVFDTRTAEPSIAPCLFWENDAMKYYVNGANRIVSTSTFPIGTWAHVAIVRSSGVTKMYVNGVQEGDSYTDTNNYVGTVTNIGGRFAAVSGDFRSWFGYMSNVRIVKGTAVYTSNFTPSTQPLTAIAGTVLLTCADNRFVDDSPNNFAVTRTGDVRVTNFSPLDAQVQTTASYSAYFDGTGDYLLVPNNNQFNFGSQNFTIECWIYPNAVSSGEQTIASLYGYTNDRRSWDILLNTSRLEIRYSSNGSTATTPSSALNTIVANSWQHIALVRNGSSLVAYVNGISVISASFSGTLFNNTVDPVSIGSVGPNYTGFFNGYISNLRIVKGTAVYTANFTPSTSPLTAISGTSLLTCQSNTFIDNSTNNFAITAFGNSRPTTFNPFTVTYSTKQSYTPSVYGGSMYFDGTGDYLLVPTSTTFGLGTSNFTIELWFYTPTKLNATPVILSTGNFGAGKWQLNDRHSGTPTKLTFNLYNASTSNGWLTSTSVITNNTWYHVAIVRNGNAFTMYLNGIAEATATYTGSADGGTTQPIYVAQDAGQAGTNYNGYISDIRITKGQALYTSNFVPQNKPLTAVTNSILLLNGTSAGIVDATTKTVLETVGNAQISTAVSKFGGSSMFFDGTGDYLIAPASNLSTVFGTGDFTVEFWINRSSGTRFVEFSTGLLYIDGNGKLVYYSTSARIVSTDVFPSNTWVYVALVRASGQSKLYINGVQTGSTFADTINYTSGALVIGTDNGSKSLFLNGYMQDLRITQGVARYTADFTPPTSAFNRK